jgi:catechol 2,3-dioxygenase-like lactoylglutathione lyase family enzyme
MANTCNHIGLFSPNPEELIAFYVEKLGFEQGESRRLPEELVTEIFSVTAPCWMTKLSLGDITLEVFSPEGRGLEIRPAAVSGYNHWGLTVEDKAAFCRSAQERGAEVIKAAYKDRFVYFIKDPEGNLIEVFES